MTYLERMITIERATIVARSLFAEDFHEGDCKNYYETPGKPCPICAERNEQWANRIKTVRTAMMEAFR